MISVLMPSRGRPNECKEAYDSCVRTARGEIEIMVYLDENDPQRPNYKVPYVVGKPMFGAQACLELLKTAKGDLFYFGSDDQRWETEGWDLRFAALMPEDGLSIIYPRDQKQGQKGMNPCWSRKWSNLFGHYPNYFQHFGPDMWLIDIARRAGTLIKADDVYIAHKRIKDDTHHRVRQTNDANFAKDKIVQTESQRQEIAEKIKSMRMHAAVPSDKP